jgi:hypothetical protein
MSRQIGAAGHHIDALHDGEQDGQAERQRHEQEVIQRGEANCRRDSSTAVATAG